MSSPRSKRLNNRTAPRPAANSATRKIHIHTDLAAGCFADVDVPRIRQAFANLLDNAVKYTKEEGRIDIQLRCYQEEVAVMIRDTGIGIPADELPKIWDRLYRGDKSRSQRGLGLGLRLVKAFVEAHGGRIEVRSEPGAFAEFTVRLPSTAKTRREFSPPPL